MRKPDKPILGKALMKDEDPVTKDQLDADSVFMVDGGALLHRVRWMKGTTFEELFENYDMRKSIAKRALLYLMVTESPAKGVSNFSQDRFFTNKENKSHFIKLLGQKLRKDDLQVKICEGDAETTIVATSLEQAGFDKRAVVKVADDTDVAIMLLFHWKEHDEVIFFQERGNKGWNIKNVPQQYQSFRKCLLFVHA